MELTLAGMVAALGLLFGLNYVGLFVAAYVFDRTAKHILWYLIATLFFILSGVAFLLSSLTPYKTLLIIVDDVSAGFGFIALSWGLARAFSLRLSKPLLAGFAFFGTFLVAATVGLGEISVERLTVVSIWHAAMPVLMGILILMRARWSLKSRYLSAMLFAAALSVMIRPFMAAQVQTYATMSHAEQVEFFGAVVSIPYLAAMFGIAAGVFFHVMSDLVAGYRSASITDSLTGLLNRRGFLGASRKVSVLPSALIMLDIDRFKSINDTLGHDAGDRVIAAVAGLLAEAAPEPHICGRLGGEEFAILLSRAELEVAEALAQSIRLRIEVELTDLLPGRDQITASFGVAALGPKGIEPALISADRAMYRAKQNGRNQVQVANGEETGSGSRAGGRRGSAQSGTIVSTM